MILRNPYLQARETRAETAPAKPPSAFALQGGGRFLIFRALGEPVFEGGDAGGVFFAAGEEAGAVLGHGVLISRLVAEVAAPADAV